MKAIAARALQRLHGALKAARVIIHAMHLVAIIKQLQASVRPNVASGASHSYVHSNGSTGVFCKHKSVILGK